MEVKKNPHADLNRDRGLYFVIGLSLVLFVTWRALEHKTYDPVRSEIIQFTQDLILDEELEQTQSFQMEIPPPPPSAPDVIEVVDDTEDIVETIIESTEVTQETVIKDRVLEVGDIQVEEEEEEISVPFAIIENVPIFPGCENLDREAQRMCFSDKVQDHIKANFKYPKHAEELGIQGRVYVTFDIDSKGKVTNLRARGPDKNLEQEAIRILSLLPTMTPGKQRGRPVTVPYSIPVHFKII